MENAKLALMLNMGPQAFQEIATPSRPQLYVIYCPLPLRVLLWKNFRITEHMISFDHCGKPNIRMISLQTQFCRQES